MGVVIFVTEKQDVEQVFDGHIIIHRLVMDVPMNRALIQRSLCWLKLEGCDRWQVAGESAPKASVID